MEDRALLRGRACLRRLIPGAVCRADPADAKGITPQAQNRDEGLPGLLAALGLSLPAPHLQEHPRHVHCVLRGPGCTPQKSWDEPSSRGSRRPSAHPLGTAAGAPPAGWASWAAVQLPSQPETLQLYSGHHFPSHPLPQQGMR